MKLIQRVKNAKLLVLLSLVAVELPLALALSSCTKDDVKSDGGKNNPPEPITYNIHKKVGMNFRMNDAESTIQGAALQIGSNSNVVINGFNTYLTADDATNTSDASKLATGQVTRPDSKKVTIYINAANITYTNSSKPGYMYRISAVNPDKEIITYSRDTTDTPLATFLTTNITTNSTTGQITYTNTHNDIYQVRILANDVTKFGVVYRIFKDAQEFTNQINKIAQDANKFAQYYGVSNLEPKSSTSFYPLNGLI